MTKFAMAKVGHTGNVWSRCGLFFAAFYVSVMLVFITVSLAEGQKKNTMHRFKTRLSKSIAADKNRVQQNIFF